MREYNLIADWYGTDRGRTVGVAEALAVAARLPAGSCILDIGCGNGVPITEALVKAGHRVVGLDTSTGMLARFRVNLPGTPAVRGDVRNCPFSDGSGRTGEAPSAGFAIRGRELVVYLVAEGEEPRSLLSKLGKHKMGKACLYFKQLADLDRSALEKLVVGSVGEVRRRYG